MVSVLPYTKVPLPHWSAKKRASRKEAKRRKRDEKKVVRSLVARSLSHWRRSERAAGKKVGGIQDALPLLCQPTDAVARGGRGRVARRARAHFGTQVNLRSCERRLGAPTTAGREERVRAGASVTRASFKRDMERAERDVCALANTFIFIK